MMGLSQKALWISWFFTNLVIFLTSLGPSPKFILVIIFHFFFSRWFCYNNFPWLWHFFDCIYYLRLHVDCFFLWCSCERFLYSLHFGFRCRSACASWSIRSILFDFGCFLPPNVRLFSVMINSFLRKLLTCLSAPACMSQCITLAAKLESRQRAASW